MVTMQGQSRATILIVEDDPGVSRLEQLTLERAGYAVIRAATAEEALAKLGEVAIDLIVLDQRLAGGMTGLELFAQVKSTGCNAPAILVTGLQDERLLVTAIRAGVRDFVPKTPNFVNHLEPIVNRVLEQVRTERELAESRIMAREHESRRRALENEISQRKRVEQALREAEEYLRLMVESVKDFAIFTVDPQGVIVSWNPGAEQLFGYPEDEVLGRHLGILFTPEDQAGGVPEQEIATAAAQGRSSDERWHERKDGRRFFASGVLTPMFDEDNRLRGFAKIARDITERKRAEEAVREAAVRLKAIVDTAVDGIITIDEHGTVESMNQAAERIFGYSHLDVVGKNVAMLMAEPERSAHDQYLANYLETGRAKIIGSVREVIGRRHDGTTFPMELAVSETRLGTRRIFTGIVRDITDYRKALDERTRLVAELDAERALLNTLLDNAPVGFGFFDHELRYVRINPALAEINGLPIEAHLGRTISDVLPQIAAEMSASFRQVLATGRSLVNVEVVGATPRGASQERYWLCNFYPVMTEDGTILGAGVVVSDIDDRKRMEEALKDADQRKDQFLAMLAHELRNPLAPISNAVQIMQIEGQGGRSFQWSLKVIEDQIKHMTRMVDDLLDVSRITRGKVDLQQERVLLSDVIELAIEGARPLLQTYEHDLSISLPAAPIYLDIDPPRMAQVLSNLLNNAAKYTDSGGRIELAAAVAGAEVVIKVRDNGIGMSPELLNKIFDMFMQGDQTLSRSRGGLGIGLTLVRSLLEMHGGRVLASSAGPGQGSEFTVILPVAAPPDSSASQGQGDKMRAPSLPRRRILVVDDNLTNAASLGVLLDALGQDVFTAHDGPTALELAQQYAPDVILLDIGLPGVDGYEVARRCRREPRLEGATLVAMTGYGKEEDRHRSQQAGFNAHLVKPVNPEDLRLLLEGPGIAGAESRRVR